MTSKGAGDAKQATELLRFASQLDEDDELRRHGEQPIFALDSNVAIFLSQPSSHATSVPQGGVLRRGFGAVFDDDPADLSDVVSHALAEHIYLHLRPWGPMLLIPPVASELHRYARGLARAHANPPESELKRWQTEGARFLSKLEAQGEFSDSTETLIRHVQEVLFLRYGPSAALTRLRHILGRRHLVSSDVAASQLDGPSDLVLRRALDPIAAARNVLELTVAANDWLKLGLDRGRSEENNFHDGFVMARLEWANRLLKREGSPHQIIYVTADRKLLEAVGRAGNPFLRLRHPRAWLTRLSIFQLDEERQRTSLVDLLKLAARGGGDADEQNSPDETSEWTQYLEAATASFVPRPETRDMFFDKAKDMLARYSTNIDRFYADLSELQAQAWENCFSVSAMTAASEAQQSHRYYSRNVPPLVFEVWEVTQRAIDTFLEWHTPHDFDQAAFQDLLAHVDVEDPTGYARYVALGIIFASRGDWDAAASLAKRANELANPGSCTFGGANAREGTFLEAVCNRYVAKDEDGLAHSSKLLEKAAEIAQAERAQLRFEDIGVSEPWDIVPERFEAERLAAEVNRFYFRRYGHDGSIKNNDVPFAAVIISRLDDLLVHARARLLDVSADSTQARALRQVISRTIVNILGLSIVSRLRDERAGRAWDIATEFGLASDAIDGAAVSNVTAITVLAYRRLVSGEKSSRHATKLRTILSAQASHQVFPYDPFRFAEIERIVFNR